MLSLACGGCGGSGGSALASEIDFGLVSGTRPTTRTLPVSNPLDEAAWLSVPASGGAFVVSAASLPSLHVAAGATLDLDVVFSPDVAGVVTGSVLLRFQGASRSEDVVLALRATTEAVRVLTSRPALEFGAVPFGSEAEHSIELSNVSTLSVVTYTGLSAPTADISLVDPPLPLVLAPGVRRTLRVRAAPYRNLDPIRATCRLEASSVQGSVNITVSLDPLPGRKVFDLGALELTNDETPLISIEVPAHVWSFHVAAWIPGQPLPDYDGNPDAPPALAQFVRPTVLRSPAGKDHSAGWWMTNGTFAATLPRSQLAADQLDAGGGVYQVKLRVDDAPPPGTRLAVRLVLKAAPGGQAPATATLDLNVWLGSATGVTPATAAQDVLLQAYLQAAGQLLAQVGVSLGEIAYYGYTEYSGLGHVPGLFASLRDALASAPVGIADRLNLFLPAPDAGSGGRIPGPYCARTNHSFAMASYGSSTAVYLIVHEMLHHLGLLHVDDDKLSDTGTGFIPANIMDVTAGRAGTYISPQQGAVVRAHPFLR